MNIRMFQNFFFCFTISEWLQNTFKKEGSFKFCHTTIRESQTKIFSTQFTQTFLREVLFLFWVVCRVFFEVTLHSDTRF
jgi:hypothetical protein